MHARELDRWASTFHRGLERWDRWLQERLAPARVALMEWRVPSEGECAWSVEYPFGAVSVVRIPRSLVEASVDEFREVTRGLGAYAWESALEEAGERGIRLGWH